MSRTLLVLLALVACKGADKDQETGPTLGTGWFTDTADPEVCQAYVVGTEPEADVTDWYWRYGPTVLVNKAKPEAYRAFLRTADGIPVATVDTWDDTQLRLSMALQTGLQPSTDYVLDVDDCRGRTSVPFRTSELGTPLETGNAALAGSTYHIDLTAATWLEPGGFGAILALYFTTPVLIGVESANDAVIDLMGAQGIETDDGEIIQNPVEPSFDFPAANFVEAPFFEAEVDAIDIEFNGVSVPISDFFLSATVSSDGSRLGGGTIKGLGDTRNMGVLVEKPDELDAICNLALTLGVVCEPCPDGEAYCLFMHATNVDGELLPGLELEPRN